MVPTSLLTSITETSAVPASTAAATASGSTTPVAGTGKRVTRKPSAARRSQDASTPLCSNAVVTTASRPSVARARRAAPFTARLSASVPPAVNTTSLGSAPSSAATSSRASSRAVFAARAAEWAPLGLPKVPPRNGAMAATASGRTGVVAAWSR